MPSSGLRLPNKLDPKAIRAFLDDLFGDDFHAKRVLSLVDGVLGVLSAASLAIHAIGRALALAKDLSAKHATKQIDRLLSNEGLALPALLRLWAGFVLGFEEELCQHEFIQKVFGIL
jgi:hypothetical protein